MVAEQSRNVHSNIQARHGKLTCPIEDCRRTDTPNQIEKLARTDGTTDSGRQPRLAAWEVPRRDPAEPRPNAPDVAARRRAARQRWRKRSGSSATSPHPPTCPQ